jgi:transposase-like protein
MGEHRRKADGRRVFSTDFKRATVQRVVTGEKTVAELSRELDIAPSVIRSAGGDSVSASQPGNHVTAPGLDFPGGSR